MLSGPKRSIWIIVAASFVGTLPLLAQTQNRPGRPAKLTVDQIVTRMEQTRIRNKETPPFLLTREYKMFRGDDAEPSSRVKAQLNVVPPKHIDYKILDTEGSGRGEKIVRKILDHEAAAEKASPSPTGIDRSNYDFSEAGRQMFEGVNCYVLWMKPKREQTSLIAGRVWVDPNTFAIRKIEGKLAKSPSWWVKEVDVIVTFGDMGGVWIQTGTQAVADVRIIGHYTVLGRALQVQPEDAVAWNKYRALEHQTEGLPATFIYPGIPGARH